VELALSAVVSAGPELASRRATPLDCFHAPVLIERTLGLMGRERVAPAA
jgi:hypothetical protein